MTEELTLTTERVDDIPLLLSQLEKMHLSTLIDQHFPTHGNWKGLSLGKVIAGWLSFILSESNHRLNHVQPFIEQRLTLFQNCLDSELRALDFSDDRLASALDYFSVDERWEAFEAAVGQNSLRVYDLECQRVRVDATTAKSYVGVTADGLFQFGHSKDGRNDLAQVKINLSVLDPLGLPLTTTIVSGQCADDPLYVPEIKRVQQLLEGKKGVTYIGDCKMAARSTRAFVATSGDYYLCPLGQVQVSAEELTELLTAFAGTQNLEEVFGAQADAGTPQKMAEGYAYEVEMASQSTGEKQVWRERRFVVRSLKYAAKQKQSLLARMAQAQQEIESLNDRKQGKRALRSVEELAEAARQVLQKQRVEGLLKLEYAEAVQRTQVRKYAGREGSWREEKQVRVSVEIEREAVQTKTESLGFRVYGTNHPTLTLEEVVKGYRAQYVIEHRIGRLKGNPCLCRRFICRVKKESSA
ncbi:MAG: DUF4277 domain-containing protein [Pyrinomonadaceae bacterium]